MGTLTTRLLVHVLAHLGNDDQLADNRQVDHAENRSLKMLAAVPVSEQRQQQTGFAT